MVGRAVKYLSQKHIYKMENKKTKSSKMELTILSLGAVIAFAAVTLFFAGVSDLEASYIDIGNLKTEIASNSLRYAEVKESCDMQLEELHQANESLRREVNSLESELFQ